MDLDTFVIQLYVKVDEFCQTQPVRCPDGHSRRPGRKPSLSPSEVLTLALFGQFSRFRSERDFYRFARARLSGLFPRLPAYSQFNRLLQGARATLEAFLLSLSRELIACTDAYEAVDGCAIAVRDRRRRGEGWLGGLVNIGKSNRLGFYEGFHLLDAVNPIGVMTGYGLAPASTNDQKMLDAFLALRSEPPGLLTCTGVSVCDTYLADKGFSSDEKQKQRKEQFNATVICAPQQGHGQPWSKADRLWLARHRQIIETVHDKLLHTFRLDRERPHSLTGFLARLNAKMALHNFCIWLNRQLGRNNLAFADLLGWV